jgi:NADH-quinone oxidoreductase subunit A
MSSVVVSVLPIFLFIACAIGLAVVLLLLANAFNPGRPGRVKRMPYESGMDPIHDTRRRFDVRFHLLAIAFLVFDVELLFLYPWAVAFVPAKFVASAPAEAASAEPVLTPAIAATAEVLRQSPTGRQFAESRHLVFAGVMVFIALLTLGFIYDWRKGIFRWR